MRKGIPTAHGSLGQRVLFSAFAVLVAVMVSACALNANLENARQEASRRNAALKKKPRQDEGASTAIHSHWKEEVLGVTTEN
ncbi:hypothetical protein SAMN02745206_00212 [Desulfacinum infernum DSM 9756]|uniref:Uncharacterized protein n=1 Tax=Desulfacinum infernum DSM 9756 TaxID=1121391 RepID=A0A1M4T6P4_9BACT|nr:hypothetical protein SAMN02745206_00212 [Desulfacinum infernum DSM 9756]